MQLHETLFARTKGAVLALYFLNPGQRFHVREVVRRLGTGHSMVQKEVQSLWKSGLLSQHRHGKRLEYQANEQSFVYHQLRALLERTAGPVGELHEVLRPLVPVIDLAFIYGSVASNTAKPGSDLDLLVVGHASFAQVVRAVRPAQDSIGMEINPSVYPRQEFLAKVQAADPFLQTILKGPKKFVIGDERELAGLA